MRRPALLLFLPLLVLALALPGNVPSQATEPSPTPSPSPSASSPAPVTSPTATPDPKYVDPSPVLAPEPPSGYTGSLKPGDWVQVIGEGCLNARTRPGLSPAYPEENPNDTILNCLPEGFIGRLASGANYEPAAPVQADGHSWWYLVAQGWVAEDWLAFHHEGSAFWPPRTDLSGAGLIAYIGADNNIWLMNADGSDQRLLASVAAGKNEWIDYLAWSPTGQQISFSVSSWSADGSGANSVLTRVVDLSGGGVADLSDLTAAAWSPDGGRLSAIRVEQPGDMGGQYGAPIVRDMISGAETAIGPDNWYGPAPVWSPDGTSLAFYCSSSVSSFQAPDGSIQETRIDCGGDGLRIVSADGAGTRVILPASSDGQGPYYGSFSWSPAGDVIAVASYPPDGEGCDGYLLVNVNTGNAGVCLTLPPDSGFGGCGFSAERGASDWSPDARYLLHHGQFGGGRNGVWVVEVATGDETLIPVFPVGSIAVSSNGQQIAFDSAGSIWIADFGSSASSPIADGRSPAWQPTS